MQIGLSSIPNQNTYIFLSFSFNDYIYRIDVPDMKPEAVILSIYHYDQLQGPDCTIMIRNVLMVVTMALPVAKSCFLSRHARIGDSKADIASSAYQREDNESW